MDAELVRWLNLVHRSPTFVVSEDEGLIQAHSVPPTAGMTMIAGTTVVASGHRIDSVFQVDADGGELHGVYWLIDGDWLASSDEAAILALGLTERDVFPFDWELAVTLDVDRYRDGTAPRRPNLP